MKILMGLGLFLALAVITVTALGLTLLGRLNRNSETTFTDDDTDYASVSVPMDNHGEAVITPTPEAFDPTTPEQAAMPLSDVYAQTSISAERLAQIMADYKSDDFISILLIGVDRRGSKGNANADTMMIATIDKRNKRLKLTTLMRDMLVDIPGYGYGKLNSSAALGGVKLLLETITHNFYITVAGYVLVDFSMFEQIVELIGGITIAMTAEEISAANDCIAGLNKETGVDYLWDGFIFAEAGPVKLTGKQALGYARIRKTDSDFTRTERQFKVISTIFAQVMRMSLTKQYSLIYDLLPLVETNLGNMQIIEIAIGALQMDTGGILHFRAPADNSYQNGSYSKKSVLLTDIGANVLLMHSFITGAKDVTGIEKELTPNPSLPPRTPAPSYGLASDTSLW